MSEPERVPSPTWLVVLPPGVSEESLRSLRAGLEARGWTVDHSRGEEQVVLAVAGPRAASELRALLPPGDQADLLPLRSAEEYRRRRARRRFLSALGTGLALLIAAGVFVPLWGFLQPPREEIAPPDLVPVEPARDLAVGQAVLARIEQRPLLVVHLAPERWTALSAICTYEEGCTLEWSAERRAVSCPCHGCAYDGYGNAVHPPASIPLAGHEVLVERGQVLVRRSGR